MKELFFVIFSVCIGNSVRLQELPTVTQEQLEDIAQNPETEPEDDNFIVELEQYRKRPMDLNLAGSDELRTFTFLSEIQIGSLIRYRELMGQLVSIYELQAVPGWDMATIRKILPYIAVNNSVSLKKDLLSGSKRGEHQLMLRVSSVLEKTRAAKESIYPGSPFRIFFRYRFKYKNSLQWGITGDKDAGETFFGKMQPKGFDFYSAHFFVRNRGILESFVVGDYTVNLGQGLIHWQGMAFGKSAELNSSKRQGAVIRPYSSAGEYNFMRGAAISFRKRYWRATALFSLRKMDANDYPDTISQESAFSSILTSGFHRTIEELKKKSNLGLMSAGGNLSFKKSKWHAGINVMFYKFSHSFEKRDEPYNLYSIHGRKWWILSVDHGYTTKNLHLFGEFAIDRKFNRAFIEGLMMSVHPDVDLALLLRVIEPGYQSLFGNAFTENGLPSNENGIYAGVVIRPVTGLRTDIYSDLYHFPWLKYRTDAPSSGSDYFIQLSYVPDRRSSVLMRFRVKNKHSNIGNEQGVTEAQARQTAINWRMQGNMTISTGISVRARAEINWFNKEGYEKQEGFLLFTDLLYKPMGKPFGLVARVSMFETGGYDSRIYAYENNVLYGYSIPAFSGKGFRYYINFDYDLGGALTCWLRWGQTIYSEISSIGSGWDEIEGRRKSEWTVQMRWVF